MDYTSICPVQRATDRSGCLKYSLRSVAISNMSYIPMQKSPWWRSTLRMASGATLASFIGTYLVHLFPAGCMLTRSSKHYNRVECWSLRFMLFYPAFRYSHEPGRNHAAHWGYSGSMGMQMNRPEPKSSPHNHQPWICSFWTSPTRYWILSCPEIRQ